MAETGLDPIQEDPEKQGLPIIAVMRLDSDRAGGRREGGGVADPAVGDGRHQVDGREFLESVGDGDQPPLGEGVAGESGPQHRSRRASPRAGADQSDRIRDQRLIAGVGAVPFQHREFRMMGRRAIPISKRPRQLEYLGRAGDQQLLHGEFGGGVQIAGAGLPARRGQGRGEGEQMRLRPRHHLQRRRFDLVESLVKEPSPQRAGDFAPLHQEFAPDGETFGAPPSRRRLFRPRVSVR